MTANRGVFITFEGGDGAGKSTHLQFVADALRMHGEEVVCLREPGGTIIGEHEIWGGVPAKFIKKVDPEQAQALNKTYARHYIEYSDWFREADSDPKNTQTVTTSEDYKH